MTRSSSFRLSGDLLDGAFELLPIDWFGQVTGEPRGQATFDVCFHSVAAERDAGNAAVVRQVAHQFVAAPVRQSEIADENVEPASRGEWAGFGEKLARFAQTRGPGDVMAGALEQARQLVGRIGVIFEEENAQGARCR